MPCPCRPLPWLLLTLGLAALGLHWCGVCAPRGGQSGPANAAAKPSGNDEVRTPAANAACGPSDDSDPEELAAACAERADWALRQLGPSGRVLVRVPFVIGGDVADESLDRWHRETIAPAAHAITLSYLVRRPSQPITLLLFSGPSSYREQVRSLFGEGEPPRFGSYRPHLRVLTLDLTTGPGTVAHELTHALVDFDFPHIPEWLGEGLASLHEAYRLVDGRLEGLNNWRLPILLATLREGRLRTLESLITGHDFHGSQEKVNYAQARYFCLYLQRLGRLAEYYRGLRAGSRDDPTGLATLLSMFPGYSIGRLDADFRRWVTQLRAEENASAAVPPQADGARSPSGAP